MKHLITFLFWLSALIVFTECSSKKEKQQDQPVETISTRKEDSILLAEIKAMPDDPPFKLRRFSEADVAKFTMAIVMGQHTSIITATKSDDFYIVSYNRPSDRQRFTYKVKIEGNRAIWANIDGRWRDTPDDEYIVFSEVGKKLKINTRYSDGSSDEKLFSK